MAANKLANLQNVLNSTSGKAPPPVPAARSVAPPANPATKAVSRVDKVNISAWLHKDFKKSIRLVQAKKADNAELQDLMAEAFNELFAKYNVPTVNQE
jgi:hypothetical protein